MTAVLLFQVAAKVTIVLAAAWGLTRAMARCSAASRHLLWVLAIVAALAVPAVQLFGPAWDVAVLPQTAVEAPAVDAATAIPDAITAGASTSTADEAGVADALAGGSAPGVALAAPAAEPFDWAAALVRLWVGGAFLLLLRLVAGLAWASWIAGRATPVTDAVWLDLLEDSVAALGVTSRVSLRTSNRTSIPMATGLWKPAVLLPPGAERWSSQRRQVVLLHELAHVKRRDCLVQSIAQVAYALHWFNPVTHLAVARLRTEQERACDDLVIEAGTDARTYADHLFEIARAYRATSIPAWATLAMARPSQLEGRMVAILDARRSRRPPSPWTRVAATCAVAAAVLPFGALQLSAAARGARQTAPVARAGEFVEVVPIVPVPPADAVDQPRVYAPPEADGPSSIVGDSIERVADALPDLGFDVREFFDLATPSFLLMNAVQVDPKTLTGPANLRNVTGDQSFELSQAPGTPVTDDTRRRVADALIIALGDENPDVREEALSALAEMRDERAIPGLIKALGDANADVRTRALSALVQFDTPAAAEGVITALKDRSPDVREHAARVLGAFVSRGQFRDPKYVDVFAALLKDDNADVREQAVVALGRMRMPTAEAPLTQALKDAAPDVRQQAARALGQLRSADAVPAIIALLKDPEKDVREQAALALGNIADPRAIDPLTAALKDSEPEVREQVARALGQIARGQRRNVLPVPPPVPAPPRPPRALLDLDTERIREQAERAAERARDLSQSDVERMRRDIERAQRDVERQMRDFDFDFNFDPFLGAPSPAPLPAPAPRASPAPPAPAPRPDRP